MSKNISSLLFYLPTLPPSLQRNKGYQSNMIYYVLKDTGFISRHGDGLSWLSFFVVFLGLFCKMPRHNLKLGHGYFVLYPSNSLFINHPTHRVESEDVTYFTQQPTEIRHIFAPHSVLWATVIVVTQTTSKYISKYYTRVCVHNNSCGSRQESLPDSCERSNKYSRSIKRGDFLG
jgi:hypothetical protein